MPRTLSILSSIGATFFLSSCTNTDVSQNGSTKTPKTSPRISLGYSVQGPWKIGDPVHEVLTLLSLRSAMEKHKSTGNLLAGVSLSNLPDWNSGTAHSLDARTVDKSLHQFLRGVFWPDDPEGLFFNDRKDASRFSLGLKWQTAYMRNPSNPKNITARSHFGDLQYVHAMSPGTSLSREAVQREVLKWAEFLVDVSTGRTEPSRPLSAIPSVAGRFPMRSTVKDLFLADPSAPDIHIRQRAAGTLLHLVQDSYSSGHTERSDNGAIVSFHCYSDPGHDRSKHALYDEWADGATLEVRVRNTRGAATAVEKGARLFALVNSATPKSEILRFLRAGVLNLMSP